ncbi:hypothetical protein ABTP29_04875 [Acinetobacter baumannii]
MHIKDKQKKPNSITDQFEKLDIPKATEDDLKLAKKNFRALLKELSLQENSSVHEFHQIKTNLKNIKEIKIHTEIKIEYSNKIYSYKFLNIRGSLVPEYLQKEIYDCNFLDVEIMRVGTYNASNSIIQLFTGIIIIFATFIESILLKVVDPTITIEASLQHCQEIIDTYEEDRHKSILSIFEYLAKAIDIYEKLDLLDSFIEDPEGAKKQYKNEPCFIDKLKSYRESMYIDSGIHLEQAINECIALGLFKQYQRSPNSNKKIEKIPVICEGHTLLNNTKLLKKLNGSSLNAEGNLKKKHNFEAIDNKILELLKQDKFKNKYKSKNAAAEKIADEIAKEIEVFMENDRDKNNHNQHIKLENLPTRILKLINKNPDLHEHLINK